MFFAPKPRYRGAITQLFCDTKILYLMLETTFFLVVLLNEESVLAIFVASDESGVPRLRKHFLSKTNSARAGTSSERAGGRSAFYSR